MPHHVAGAFLALVCLCGPAFAAEVSGVWLDVPFVKQEKDGCGAASIAMVMQYWFRQQNQQANESSDALRIQRALYSRDAHGIYASQMEGYFQQHGFRTFTIRGEWADLGPHLEKGRPLIVALKPTPGASLHYVVVVGIDRGQGLVLLNDPAERKLLKRHQSSFEEEWSAAGKWTLLALPQTAGNR
jgi:ABC-type bacteriocin/lantibiotic exporter with double-glycine peptidase domain